MENLIVAEVDILVLLAWYLIGVGVVDVINLALLIPVGLDIFREERIQRQHVVFPVPDDLRIAVAPQEQMGHHRLPEGKARHFRIRLPIQELVQRVVRCLLLGIHPILHPVEMKRKPCHCLSQEPDAGIYGRDLHRALLIHLLAGVGFSEHKGLPGVADVVCDIRSIAGTAAPQAQPLKHSHFRSPP